MKKNFFTILFFIFLISSATAQNFERLIVGVDFELKPLVYTGDKKSADNEYQLFAQDIFRSYDNIKHKQSSFTIGFQGYTYYRLNPLYGFGVDISYFLFEGYGTKFYSTNSKKDITISRTFTTFEVFPQFRYYLNCDPEHFFALKVGPNITFTGENTKFENNGQTKLLDSKLQNNVLYGLRAGFDVGFDVNMFVYKMEFCIAYDFNPTYNPKTTSSSFSKSVGNRLGFYIGFGIGLPIL